MPKRSSGRRDQQDLPRSDGPNDLERHVARCRRNGASAALLVARTSGGSAFPAGIEQRLRVSDSWMRTRPHELVLLCDVGSLDRALVERRLRALTADTLLCGWAGFPDDGLLVDDLLAAARRAAAPGATDRARSLKLLGAGR